MKLYIAVVSLLGFSFFCFPQKINKAALVTLLEKAEESHTDTLVILHNGKKIADYYSDGGDVLVRTMSVTKSIINLAFGLLVTRGKLDTLDHFIYEWYPEWKQGRKQSVTLRNFLSHTSGIKDEADFHIEIYESPNFVKLALAADLLYDPGLRFSYSNKASNLLPGIFEKIAHEPIDRYLSRHLFKPLGISYYTWDHDKAGNVYGLGGLALRAEDLARIGQLVLQRGVWQGKRIINETWFDLSLQQSQPYNPLYGLLWWLIPEKITYVIDDIQLQKLRDAKLDDLFIELVASIKGNYHSELEYNTTLKSIFGKNWHEVIKERTQSYGQPLARREDGRIIGYCAEGWLGQYLAIYPEKNLIGVRLIKETPSYNKETDWFKDFPQLIDQLVD